jgi:hypothetical protein
MPHTIARIFWLKSRAKWRESSVVAHENGDGSPMTPHGETVNIWRVNLPDNGRDPLPEPKVISGRVFKKLAAPEVES